VKLFKSKDNKVRKEVGKELDGLINAANMQGSNILGKMMLKNLTFGIESSRKFSNSEEQVDSFLDKYPSMLIYRQEIIDKAKTFRKVNGLPE
jgi:hypothetical protein